jgi:hypothetical protein
MKTASLNGSVAKRRLNNANRRERMVKDYAAIADRIDNPVPGCSASVAI